MDGIGPSPQPSVLFVYGTLLRGECNHVALGGADCVGPAITAPRYTLVDLGPYPALVEEGEARVVGELYPFDRSLQFKLDVLEECPVLFQRIVVTLDDGSLAQAYAMRPEQVRGKRRLKHGSWRDRFAPRPRRDVGGPLVDYLRRRTGR